MYLLLDKNALANFIGQGIYTTIDVCFSLTRYGTYCFLNFAYESSI